MGSNLKIAVLGANGQLGQEFRKKSTELSNWQLTFFTSQDLDITNKELLKEKLPYNYFDYVINCAAYTAVDKAETEQKKCWDINAHACLSIAQTLEGSDTKIVHFSSDYVYDNGANEPMMENSPTLPQNTYAQSKLKGEELFRSQPIPVLILRTSWVISTFGHNFVKTMLRLGREKSDINVVNDQVGAPTYTQHLVEAVVHIIQNVETGKNSLDDFNQTYNFANLGQTSWYGIAKKIMDLGGFSCDVHPIPTKDYPTPAKRPLYSVMSMHKIQNTFSLDIPHWTESVEQCVERLRG